MLAAGTEYRQVEVTEPELGLGRVAADHGNVAVGTDMVGADQRRKTHDQFRYGDPQAEFIDQRRCLLSRIIPFHQFGQFVWRQGGQFGAGGIGVGT